MNDPSDLMTPGEVAVMFRVDPKTVTRWCQMGRISSIRTPGGHRRFFRAEVEELLAANRETPASVEIAQLNRMAAARTYRRPAA